MNRYLSIPFVIAFTLTASVKAAPHPNLDYMMKWNQWLIVGWTDDVQVTCGVSNDLDFTSPNHFDIDWQAYGGKEDFNRKNWLMDIGTRLPDRVGVDITMQIDDQLNIKYPDGATVSASDDAHIVGIDNGDCPSNLPCPMTPQRALLNAVGIMLEHGGHQLTITLKPNKGRFEIHRINLKGLSEALYKSEDCFANLIGRHLQ